MININLDEGLEEIMINGDENRIIKFNTGDYNLITRANEAEKNIVKKLEPLGDVKVNSDGTAEIESLTNQLSEIDKAVKEEIDYIFNSKVSEVIFGNTSTLASNKGKFLVEIFFEAVMPVVINRIESEAKASDKRMSKHTDKYNNLSPKAKENLDKLVENTTKNVAVLEEED